MFNLSPSRHSRISGFLCIAVFFAMPQVASAGGAWSRAIGEAKELQRTTKDLRNRTSRLFAYSRVAGYAIALDEHASRLIELTKNDTPSFVMESELNRFAAIYDRARVAVAANHQIASDRNVANYTSEIGRRFDRLVKDLQKATPPARTFISQYPPSYGVPVYPREHFGNQPHTPYYPAPPIQSSRSYAPAPPRVSVEIHLPQISL